MARKSRPTLLPDPSCLQLKRLEADEQSLVAIVETNLSEALCPLCQCRSESIHSRYTRVVADLPWAGWALRLELHVRRFFCQNKECKRRIFDSTSAWGSGSLCPTHDASDGSAHADRLCHGRRSWKLLGGTHGVRGQSRDAAAAGAKSGRTSGAHPSGLGRG